MAYDPTFSGASKAAALNAMYALLNGGSIKIYTGTQPAGPDTAITSQTLLATLTLSATAFASASAGTNSATITANAITGANAVATGTATWFRAFKSDGTTAVTDGSVGTATSDLILNSTSITSGAAVSVSAWVDTL